MQTKAVNHPIQRFHRTHRMPFRLLLTCAALVIFGCEARQPDIYAIAPDLCKRQIVSIGDEIASYKVGSTLATITDYTVRGGRVYYGGVKDDVIRFDHENYAWSQYVNLKDIDNEYWSDGKDTMPGSGPLAPETNEIGPNGEAYIHMDQYYIVVYSASPEELDYALQESRATWTSWEPVPCPEP